MAIEFKRLSPSGEPGYLLERLQIGSAHHKTGVIVVAIGFYLGPEFLVLEESEAFLETVSAFGTADDGDARDLRDSLIEDGTLVQRGACYVFKGDYVFQSSSLAASVILGRPTIGAEVWRDINGTKLADLKVPV